jgi:hypothetical protein
MASTTFSGPIKAGTVREGASVNVGTAVLAQRYVSGDLTGTEAGNVDVTAFRLPAGATITDIVIDATTAFTAGTATVSVGSTSGGAELAAAVAITAGGRFRGTATAATQAAWKLSTTADTTVYIRNVVGSATLTAGAFTLTVLYTQG